MSINGALMKESVAHRVVVSFRIAGHAGCLVEFAALVGTCGAGGDEGFVGCAIGGVIPAKLPVELRAMGQENDKSEREGTQRETQSSPHPPLIRIDHLANVQMIAVVVLLHCPACLLSLRL